jgi:RNase P/RNase MRP subunit POP5
MSVVSWKSVVLLAGLLLGSLGGLAHAAEGVLISPARLPAPARAQLLADLARARAEQPALFAALAELREALPELDQNKRGRLAPVTPPLKALVRQGGLHALLAELAVEAAPGGELTDSAWLTWRLGLLEAVGGSRDVRAEPVLTAILDSPLSEEEVVKAAAEALGKMGTDTAAHKLLALSRSPVATKRLGVLAGMGECRRAVIAEALAATLKARPDAAAAARIIRSLGNVGSAWAWETEIISRSGEGETVRQTAARALVSAFVAYEGETRHGALEALLVVNHPSTPALIAQARTGASPALLSELDRLADRFSSSPLRNTRSALQR